MLHILFVVIVKVYSKMSRVSLHVDRQHKTTFLECQKEKKMCFVDRVDRVAYVERVDRLSCPEFIYHFEVLFHVDRVF